MILLNLTDYTGAYIVVCEFSILRLLLSVGWKKSMFDSFLNM